MMRARMRRPRSRISFCFFVSLVLKCQTLTGNSETDGCTISSRTLVRCPQRIEQHNGTESNGISVQSPIPLTIAYSNATIGQQEFDKSLTKP